MSSVRSLLFLPGEDCQLVIIQKAFELCCIYDIGRFKQTSRQEFEWDTLASVLY